MSIKSEIRKQAVRITRLYQKEINKKDLIDTGALVRSFETKIKISKKGDLDIDVKCMDYFQYLDIPYDVSEDVFKSKEYAKIEDDLISLMISGYFIDIPDDFKSTDSVEYSFKFKNFK